MDASAVQGATAGSPPDLSVIFVTRNEEEHVEECIRSTIAAAEEAKRRGTVRSAEYVLVDSASTDRTVEIASRFPVRIVRLEPTWPLSCGAGCYVGLLHARGKFVAIINGDMTIDPRWFVDAMAFVTERVGGVIGVAKEHLDGRTPVERLIVRYSTMPLSLGELPQDVRQHPGGYSAGTFLLRTDAARAVGNYNPFLRAAEDLDMRYRLLHAGWKVLNVPVVQGDHFWASASEPLDLAPYLRTILRNSIGLGQMARYRRPRDPWVARQAARPCINMRITLDLARGAAVLALVALNLVAFAVPPAAIAAVVSDAAMVALLVGGARQRQLPMREYVFAHLVFPAMFAVTRVGGFVRGFLAPPKGPEEYPAAARSSA